jgi:hypothetical protein
MGAELFGKYMNCHGNSDPRTWVKRFSYASNHSTCASYTSITAFYASDRPQQVHSYSSFFNTIPTHPNMFQHPARKSKRMALTTEKEWNFRLVYCIGCRSQCPNGLRHEVSSPAETLGSWVRIPLEALMFVCVYSVFVLPCVGSGLATDWSPVERVLPTVYKIKKLTCNGISRLPYTPLYSSCLNIRWTFLSPTKFWRSWSGTETWCVRSYSTDNLRSWWIFLSITNLNFIHSVCNISKLNYKIVVNTVQCDSICRYLLRLHVSVSWPPSEGVRSACSETTITKCLKTQQKRNN